MSNNGNSGRKKKERTSPFLANLDDDRSIEEIDEEEFFTRKDKLDAKELLQSDAEYQKVCDEIDKMSKGRRTQYSTRDKLRAALAYTITASSIEAGRIVGVSPNTIRTWKNVAPWWPLAVSYAIEVRKEQLDAQFSEIITLAADHTIDALKNGDYKTVKTRNGGVEEIETVRVPMSAKDAMIILSIARDKQSLMRGEATRISEVKKTDEQMLDAMAEKIAKAVQGSGEVIEGMVIKEDKE